MNEHDNYSRFLIDNKLEKFIDNIMREGINSLPKEIGIEYLGYRIVPPHEYINTIRKTKVGSSIKLELSEDTIYFMEIFIKYTNHNTNVSNVISKYIILPYLRKGGIAVLSDTQYVISPVLTEYVISSYGKDVFVRLLKDKLLFCRILKNILVNKSPVTVKIVTSNAYKFVRNENNTINKNIPMALLLFVKHGFYGVFKKYFNTVPLITQSDSIDDKKYVIFESSNKKPSNLIDKNYVPHKIKICIEKQDLENVDKQFLYSIVGTLLYVFDINNLYSPGLIKIVNTNLVQYTEKEKIFWLVLLGKTIFKNRYSTDKLLEAMDEYIAAIDTYVDNYIKDKLKEINITPDDFYDLVGIIIKNYDSFIKDSTDKFSSVNNRYLDVLYYISFNIITAVNKFIYNIKKEYKKKTTGFKQQDIENIFEKYRITKKLYSIIKPDGVNICINTIDYSGDNLYYKVISLLEDQNRGDGVNKSKNNQFPPQIRLIRAEDIVFGNLLYLMKKSPSPRLKLNPYVKIDTKTNKFIIDNPAMVEKLQKLLDGRFEDLHISRNEIIYDNFSST